MEENDPLCLWFGLLITSEINLLQRIVLQFLPTLIWSYMSRSLFQLLSPALNQLLLKIASVKNLSHSPRPFKMPDISKPSLYHVPIMSGFRPFEDLIWSNQSVYSKVESYPIFNADNAELGDISSALAFKTIAALLKIYSQNCAFLNSRAHESFFTLVRNMTASEVEISIGAVISWGRLVELPVHAAKSDSKGEFLDFLTEIYTPSYHVEEHSQEVRRSHRFILDNSLLNLLVDGLLISLSYVSYDELALKALKQLNFRAHERMQERAVLITDDLLLEYS